MVSVVISGARIPEFCHFKFGLIGENLAWFFCRVTLVTIVATTVENQYLGFAVQDGRAWSSYDAIVAKGMFYGLLGGEA